MTTDRITCCMQNMRQPLIMGLHFIWATTKQWPTANLVGHTANWPRVRVLRRVVVPGGWLGFCLLPPSRSWWWSWMGVLDYTSARLIESAPQKPHYAGALSPPSREGWTSSIRGTWAGADPWIGAWFWCLANHKTFTVCFGLPAAPWPTCIG